ncbi:MAG: DNA-directed DNA polymerase II small subunit [Candidatus Bathyarchaeota archaeon]|nr:MAG: DNA-directed DNA polymerase II small subunit [Candidatus Bathyarchaeota archaeon]
MSEGEKLQRAVSFTIAAGYQLDKEAFDFLTTLSKKEDPLSLMERTIEKLAGLPENPLFVDRKLLEEMAKDVFQKGKPASSGSPRPILETRKSFRPYAKDTDANIKVLDDPTDKVCTTGSAEEYLQYFQDRFKKIKKILRRRIDTKSAMPISEALKAPVNSKVKIIGMVTEKRESKKRLFLKFEDLEASVTVLVPHNIGKEAMEKAQTLLLDQVICVSAIKGRNKLFIAKDFIWPDVPQKTPHKASLPVYAALISDLHTGSQMFMENEFNRFVSWLNGNFGNKHARNLASHVKYVVIAGDLVDGIGVYPGQMEELVIQDIYEQYREVAKLIAQIPDYIEVVIIPGNHDASRKALPQPAIPRDYAEPLYEARKMYSLGNPCTISLHEVELLLYHGRSLDDVAAVAPNVSVQTPNKSMKLLLQSRHLAPIYGERTPIAPETKDFIVIERVPDIFHAGHVHVLKCDTYRGTLLVNSGAWQGQTDYQKRMGVIPTPGIVPIVNLQTLHVSTINFTEVYG